MLPLRDDTFRAEPLHLPGLTLTPLTVHPLKGADLMVNPRAQLIRLVTNVARHSSSS